MKFSAPSSSPNPVPSEGQAARVSGIVWWALILLFLLPLLVYGRAVTFPFVNLDDDINIYNNPLLLNAGGWARFWAEPYQGLYIPVTYTIWYFLAQVAHLSAPQDMAGVGQTSVSPVYFHATNVLLHAVNTVLVYGVLNFCLEVRGVSSRRRVVCALAAALFWGLHPVQAEAVSWVTGLKDVLAGTFGLAFLLVYLRAAHRQSIGKPNAPFFGLSYVLLFLALLSKPGSVMLPAIAGVLHLVLLGSSPGRVIRPLLLPFILALVTVATTAIVQPVTADVAVTLGQRPLIAGDALAFYLIKLLLPLPLTPDHGRYPAHVLASPLVYVSWLLPAAVLIGAWWYRRLAWPGAAAGIFFAVLLPVSGLMTFAFQAFSTVADRYLYLALLGPALALAFAGAQLRVIPHTRRLLAAGAVVVLVAASLLSYRQVLYWSSSQSLWTHAVAANPRSWLANNNLGNVWNRLGDKDKAMTFYARAHELNPRYLDAANNLATVLVEESRDAEAEVLLLKCLQINPNHVTANANLGAIYLRQGQLVLARDYLEWALSSDPDYIPAYMSLAMVASATGDVKNAEANYRRVLSLDASHARAHFNLGVLLLRRNQLPEAVEQFEGAVRTEPELVEAHANMGAALLALGRRDEAIEHWRTALKLRPDLSAVRSALAKAERAPAR